MNYLLYEIKRMRTKKYLFWVLICVGVCIGTLMKVGVLALW